MNFNPDNTQTLESLLAALGDGLSSSTAYPILQQTIAAQQAQTEARKAKMQSYAEQVMQLAGSGMPQGAATTMMDLLTPRQGVPQPVQNAIQTAYPGPQFGGQEWAPGQQYRYDFPVGGDANNPADFYNAQLPLEQQQSPLFTQNPQAQMEQAVQDLQLQQAQMDMASQQAEMQYGPQPTESQQEIQAIADITRIITTARASGKPDDMTFGIIMQDPVLGGYFVQNMEKILTAISLAENGMPG